MKHSRFAVLLVLAALAAVFPCSLPALAGQSFGIVVVVNGTPITEYDVQQRMDIMAKNFQLRQGGRADEAEIAKALEQQRPAIIQNMIDEQLMDEEIKRLQLSVDPEQVDAYIKKVKEDSGADDLTFEAQLADMGVSMKEFHKKVETDMLKQRLVGGMVGAKLVITDEDIDAEFEKNTEFEGGLRYHLRTIMVPTAEEMDTVRQAVESGSMTFEEAAAAHSIGPVPQEGGDLGSIAYSSLAPDWQDALKDLDPGELAEPFQADGKYVLLQLVETSRMTVDDVPGMRDKIYKQIREKRMGELFDQYMDRLREMAVIEWK